MQIPIGLTVTCIRIQFENISFKFITFKRNESTQKQGSRLKPERFW